MRVHTFLAAQLQMEASICMPRAAIDQAPIELYFDPININRASHMQPHTHYLACLHGQRKAWGVQHYLAPPPVTLNQITLL